MRNQIFLLVHLLVATPTHATSPQCADLLKQVAEKIAERVANSNWVFDENNSHEMGFTAIKRETVVESDTAILVALNNARINSYIRVKFDPKPVRIPQGNITVQHFIRSIEVVEPTSAILKTSNENWQRIHVFNLRNPKGENCSKNKRYFSVWSNREAETGISYRVHYVGGHGEKFLVRANYDVRNQALEIIFNEDQFELPETFKGPFLNSILSWVKLRHDISSITYLLSEHDNASWLPFVKYFNSIGHETAFTMVTPDSVKNLWTSKVFRRQGFSDISIDGSNFPPEEFHGAPYRPQWLGKKHYDELTIHIRYAR